MRLLGFRLSTRALRAPAAAAAAVVLSSASEASASESRKPKAVSKRPQSPIEAEALAGFRVVNKTGYRTEDLERFAARGLRACGVRGPVTVIFRPSPIRSRGCATVSDREGDIVIAVAPPSYYTSDRAFRRRLARLFEHECGHRRGLEHHDMAPRLLYSEGGVPSWARGIPLRYRSGWKAVPSRERRRITPSPGYMRRMRAEERVSSLQSPVSRRDRERERDARSRRRRFR